MYSTEEWLNDKIQSYQKKPKETLEDTLCVTNKIIGDYLKTPNSKAARGLLETCFKHNKLFINKIK